MTDTASPFAYDLEPYVAALSAAYDGIEERRRAAEDLRRRLAEIDAAVLALERLTNELLRLLPARERAEIIRRVRRGAGEQGPRPQGPLSGEPLVPRG